MNQTTKKRAFFGFLILTAILLIGAIGAGHSRPDLSQQTAEDLYQAALLKKEAEGDLAGAIKMFQEIMAKFPARRDIAAKAQLQVGICFQKLGNDEAEKAFQKVIENFPEQSEAVSEAKEKLTALMRAKALVGKGAEELTIRKVWAGELDGLGRISPDGKSLACTDWMTGDLSILDVTTGRMRHLTDKGSWLKSREFALFMAWSPDGKQIAYGWWDEPNYIDMRVVSLEDPTPRTIHKVDNPELEVALPFGWTPDGKSILTMFAEVTGPRQISPRGKIGLVSVSDGSARVLKNLGFLENWPNGTCSMAVSPNGRLVAYSYPAGDPPSFDIFLISDDGKEEYHLIDHPANDSLFGWAPDGKSILFSSDRRGALDAYVIRIKDGKSIGQPELVKMDVGSILPQGISADGAFYYTSSKGAENVYIAQLDPERGKILNQPPGPIQHLGKSSHSPAYSPDGKYLAFVSERGLQFDVRPVLCIRSLETGKDRELHPKFAGIKRFQWSPDGDSILALATSEDSHNMICVIKVDTGEITAITHCELPSHSQSFDSVSWSRDGSSIYYVYRDIQEKVSRLLVRDLAKDLEKEIYRTPEGTVHFGAKCSPDGKRLAMIYYSREPREIILKIMPASGGEPQDLHKFEGATGAGPIDWSSDGKSIFSVVAAKDHPNSPLWRVSVDNGEAENLGLEMTRIYLMSVHPDGQQIAFSSKGPTQEMPELWVMENFLPIDKDKK